jgi:hypothetical protein
MIYLNTLELLRRHAALPFSWTEVVVGYDFGLLSIHDIQDWVRLQPCSGPAAERLINLEGQDLLRFEETLWAACVEATGRKVPRPGHERWFLAQDLWRTSLLKEALAVYPDAADFAEAVEGIIDRVGCPEDMLGLLSRTYAWARQIVTANREEVMAFVGKLEAKLLPEDDRIALAAS